MKLLKQYLLDFDNMHLGAEQGEKILEFLELPTDLLFIKDQWFNAQSLKQFRAAFEKGKAIESACIVSTLDQVTVKESMPLARVIELFAKCVNEDTFKMSKEFTIAEVVEQTYGKWGEVLGNAFWTESDHFVDNILEMGQATLYRLTG